MAKPPRQTRAPRAARPAPLIEDLFALTRTAAFERYLQDLLIELCAINTTPHPDVSKMRVAEAKCFRILERELSGLHFDGAQLERHPINPAIQNHPNFSLLHFTKTAQRPQGLTPEATYASRANLLFKIPGTNQNASGQSVALNAHLDVVAPYFPPRAKNGRVYGRGACDDKGPVVSIIAALKVLSTLMARAGLQCNRNVLAMFVVEEETGGNGSLSLAIDRKLKKLYDSIMVCECTSLKLHPANRGAVWYRAALKKLEGVSPLELFAFINEELEKEGAAIRAESFHPLFPQRPVQTCHGIIGPFGQHPSRICGEVSFSLQFQRRPGPKTEQLLRDCLEAGLASYLGLYGDKSKVTDPATGQPMVPRHYDLRPLKSGFQVDVHGATGHMGAIRERDGAITKMAHLVRSLVYSKAKLQSLSGCPLRLDLAGKPAADSLILEGGQGFVPTHDIAEVMDRLHRAAQRGAESYLRRLGRNEPGAEVVTVTYEKLHNVAFDGDPDSPSMRQALAAARMCGLWPSSSGRALSPKAPGCLGEVALPPGAANNDPILGWTVSCDARLFATEYPGMDVLTFGPGQLIHAHSDQEQIALEELRAAAEFLALFLLRQTGTMA